MPVPDGNGRKPEMGTSMSTVVSSKRHTAAQLLSGVVKDGPRVRETLFAPLWGAEIKAAPYGCGFFTEFFVCMKGIIITR